MFKTVPEPYYKTRSYTSEIDKSFPLSKVYDNEIYRHRLNDTWKQYIDIGEMISHQLCDISSNDAILKSLNKSKNLFIDLIRINKNMYDKYVSGECSYVIAKVSYISLSIDTDKSYYEFHVKLTKNVEKDISNLLLKFSKNLHLITPICGVYFDVCDEPYI